MGIRSKMEARRRKSQPDTKRCMDCYAELMARLTWQDRMEVVMGRTHQEVGLVPYHGDCAHGHFAEMGRDIRRKATEALAGRSRRRKKTVRKPEADEKNTDKGAIHAQESLF